MDDATDAIYQRLTEILREVFDDDSLVAVPELTARDIAAWDSFGHLRLVFTIESAFGISFAASQVPSFDSVGELANIIAQEISGTTGKS